MVADGQKVDLNLSSSEIASLSPEERQKFEELRNAQISANRDKALRESIGNNDLQAEYTRVKGEKAVLQSTFNELHSEVQGTLHPNYTQALRTRAKMGYAKLDKGNVFEESKKMLTKFQSAYKNLTTTGSLGGINIGVTNITDSERLTSYVSGQQNVYYKQNMSDSENYALAVDEFRNADLAANDADRTLTDAIDAERGYVTDMRVKDEQMRSISISQGYLA